MKTKISAITVPVLLMIAMNAQASTCRVIHWKSDSVIQINSALNLGTRVELPADNITDPVGSSDLWNAEGAANQVMIKPNSREEQGKKAVIRAWTADGNAYDIVANRVEDSAQNDVCVKVVADGMFFSSGARTALGQQSSLTTQGTAAANAQVAAMQQQLQQLRRDAEDERRKAVMEALRRFRYHVYTRYSWDQGKGFAAQGLISDVYDDGRFTYIRLFQPNRGLLSVETEVGEKNATVPTKYDDAYGMYVISGIYPKFTLRVDDAKISIARADGRTNGEF
ncbi:TrbG/VirB9 family P-type conjugative transfer protein [Pseudomonas sp. RIT-PI-AD]|uniref:TrbG/VirB9 family P-type conjugative transfer protein n=1 Tax=Pseudomonas sp. RIT-PI-AD TaxID=3035294 RepID=UPI0021DA1D25|nr:TrbG/VirB9 family P-type conjugative transfer protein [Pseudomonas sp. RIT-PI-AD]